ncbi:MAG: hypothetical protein ABID64_03510 [Nitrospirota bacterium]
MNSRKEKAIILRKNGKSYSEIKKALGIPKSTLSYWLKDLKIDKHLKEKLLQRAHKAGIEALIKRNKRQTVIAKQNAEKITIKSAKEIKNVNLEKLKLIGAALYFGEGGKSGKRVDFTNSNPEMIKMIMKFFRIICKVEESKFRAQLSVHEEEKIETSKRFWSKTTRMPLNQFIKVNTSISKYSKKRRNKLPYGTIQIRISDVNLFHRINGWIQGSIR